MRTTPSLAAIGAIAVLGACAVLARTSAAVGARPAPPEITWKRFVLDREFRSEGVAVADVNRDGRTDVLAGSFWYQAPSWEPRELAPVKKFDGATGYSECFLSWAADVNGDKWADQIVVGFPGEKAIWRENPKNQSGHWKEHVIWRSAGNESPAYADLLGNKKPVLVFPYDEKLMAWYEPGTDVTQPFTAHTVGREGQPGVQRFAHGMGVGDINGDRRPDILTTQGYYEAPKDPRSGPWTFVPANLGPASAQMHVYDVNRDGLPDVVASSAHDVGVWWYEQKRGEKGPEFTQHVIDKSFSQSHSLVMADINRDGTPDFVTGKRFWAHGPTGDVDPGAPAVLVWFELKRPRGKDGSVEWVRHEIDNDSGVGTQFAVVDMNKDGRPDVITSNKKGVYVHLQERKR